MFARPAFRSSSTVEHSAVNRRVVGSNPTCGATLNPLFSIHAFDITRLTALCLRAGQKQDFPILTRISYFVPLVLPQFPPSDFANGRQRGVADAGLAVRAVGRAALQRGRTCAKKRDKVGGKGLLVCHQTLLLASQSASLDAGTTSQAIRKDRKIVRSLDIRTGTRACFYCYIERVHRPILKRAA